MMEAQVHTFASLKSLFGTSFEFSFEKEITIEEFKFRLVKLYPEAESAISKTRIAIQENFVSNDYLIKDGENIYLIPPSSGG